MSKLHNDTCVLQNNTFGFEFSISAYKRTRHAMYSHNSVFVYSATRMGAAYQLQDIIAQGHIS